MAKILSVEPTPNPLAMKIKLDQKLALGGSRHFAKKEDAWDFPLAQKVFDIHGVDSLFIMDDFMTVNKTPGGIWDFIFFMLGDVLMAARDVTPLRIGEAGNVTTLSTSDFDKLSLEEKISYIDKIIDETIRPGLARDGGGLQVLSLEDNILKVRYEGACGGCPSSTAQTLQYISQMLQNRVSPNLQVQPV